jgi:hypothetical protein
VSGGPSCLCLLLGSKLNIVLTPDAFLGTEMFLIRIGRKHLCLQRNFDQCLATNVRLLSLIQDKALSIERLGVLFPVHKNLLFIRPFFTIVLFDRLFFIPGDLGRNCKVSDAVFSESTNISLQH